MGYLLSDGSILDGDIIDKIKNKITQEFADHNLSVEAAKVILDITKEQIGKKSKIIITN